MIRKFLRIFLGKSAYDYMRQARKRTLGYLGFFSFPRRWSAFAGSQAVFWMNEIYARFCKIWMAVWGTRPENYYQPDLPLVPIFRSLSSLLDSAERGAQPLFTGALEGHICAPLLPLVRSLPWSNLAFARNFIYNPSEIQRLLLSRFGLVLEKNIGARPFIYNIQLLRVFPGTDGRAILSGLSGLFLKGAPGSRGFLVLSGTGEEDVKFSQEPLGSGETSAMPGKLLFWQSDTDSVCFKTGSGPVDLLYFHAVPSMNPCIVCQQPGLDVLAPCRVWRPRIPVVPKVEIANKSRVFDAIERGEIVGLNLGGGSNYIEGYVSIDTRYGYENQKNLLPLWLHENITLPFKDVSLRYVYSSHFLEHVDDKITERLLKEAYRVLQPGGMILLVVPHFENALKYYRQGDWKFAEHWGFGDRVQVYSIHGMELTLENLTATMFAGGTSIIGTGGSPVARWVYSGSPYVAREELSEKLKTLDPKNFSRYLRSRIPRNTDCLEHVNAYTESELRSRLADAGFRLADPFGPEIQELRDSLAPHYRNQWEFVSLNVAGVKNSSREK